MADTGHWKVYGAIPEDAYGFIYEIVNTINHKKYIGKKQMVRKIRRNPLKGKKRKRVDYVESDWKTYTGSSDALNIDIASIGIDKFVFKYYRLNKSPPVQLAMVSIGVMFVTQAVVRIIIGPSDRRFFDGEKFLIKANEFKEMTGLNEGLAIKSTQVITIVVTIILVSTLFWFLNKTKTGKSMRAYSDNEDLALLSGIDPKKIVMITWMIAAILATIGGVLYGLDKSFKPFTYFNNMLPIFAAAIVGGIGNPFGAFLGGYVIAFSEILLTYAYKKFFMYVLPESMEPDGLVQLLSTDYKFAVSFSILVIVLLYRPSGIFKGKIL